MDALTLEIVISLLLLGALAACFGAALGLGGSLLLIPGLTLLFGPNQHLYQAAAMCMNVGVAIMATRRHQKAGIIDRELLKRMIPAALAGIAIGTLSSNLFTGEMGELRLRQFFALYLIYFAITPYLKKKAKDKIQATQTESGSLKGVVLTGLLMGMQAGLMGVGGGTVAVPLLQKLSKRSLKQAIVHSSAVMCCMCPLGALLKVGTLHQHQSVSASGLLNGFTVIGEPLNWIHALIILAPVLPAALPMAHVGASVGQKLPQAALKAALSVTLLLAAVRLWS